MWLSAKCHRKRLMSNAEGCRVYVGTQVAALFKTGDLEGGISMSVKNVGIMLLSTALILTAAPIVSAQSHKTTEYGDAHKATTSPEEVRDIQTALKDAGFDPGPVDGVIGPRTTKAIRTFQFHTGTLATGRLNDETLTTLGIRMSVPTELARTEESESAELPAENTEEEFIRDNLSISAESNVSEIGDVKLVQQALRDLEYNPGEINGMMSSDTQQAIREFQLLNGLPVTGTVNDQTKLALDAAMHGNAYGFGLTQREKPGEPAPYTREAHPQPKPREAHPQTKQKD
jgi:peptidoglycan hydrolase-like protein with peptidoglycan-binding domain